jgi:hypothetical protein
MSAIQKITITKDEGKFKITVKRGKDTPDSIPEHILLEVQQSLRSDKKSIKGNNSVFSRQMFKDSMQAKCNYRDIQ